MGPEPEAVLNLFDSSWFYLSLFENTSEPPISEANPNLQINETPTKLHVPRPLTIHARSKSDQLRITNLGADTDSPHLETILSGREIDVVGSPRFRREPTRKKKQWSKSLSELEFEEMKGFMDLGFVFSEEDKRDSDLVEIVPGLQKLGLEEMGFGAEEMCGPRTRPYLSEAWEVESPVTKWRLPAVGNEIDMKDSLKCSADAVQPLSRVVPLPKTQLTAYRIVIIMRLINLILFIHYRVANPVESAFGLWLTSVICEIWFAVSWVLDQFPKWPPINRETYIDRLSARYEREGEPSELAAVDFFVSTVDPLKEPPLITANTVLSILAVDYPVDKVSCYVSDDGAAMLSFESLVETADFARKWVPFCKKFSIEPRAPEFYFSQKIDYLKDKVQPSFVKERWLMEQLGLGIIH